MTLNPRIREQRLRDAVESLSKYYGLRTSTEEIFGIVNRIRNSTASGQGITSGRTTEITRNPADEISQKLANTINDILNSTIGAYKSEDIARKIQEAISNDENSDGLIENFGKMIQIIGDGQYVRNIRNTFPNAPYQKLKYASISGTEGPGTLRGRPATPNSDSKPILKFPADERPPLAGGPNIPESGPNTSDCSIILLNTPSLNISNRNTKPVSIFLNGIPPIEFAKAVPYMEVNFEFPMSAIDSESNRLLAPSLYKFILGGAEARAPSLLNTLQTANSSSNIDDSSGTSQTNINRNYTVMGMEAFTSPQIIFNQRNQQNSEARNNRVLDPTRPILSIKSFSTSEVPSYSTYSYRTAQLQMTLHDRSRMSDVASFFRADLRGNTRVDIEYGWIHPEGEKINQNSNVSPYVNLINGMRRREKYQIRNSSFQFNDSGKVEITLELVTLGQSQIATEIIINNEDTARAAILEINQLQETLSDLIGSTNLRNDGDDDRPTVRLNGIQVLDAASDSFSSGLTLSPEQRRQFRTLLNELSSGARSGNQIYNDIAQNLESIWGDDGSSGQAAAVLSGLQTQIANTLKDIISYTQGYPPAPSARTRRPANPNGWSQETTPPLEPGDPLVIKTNNNPPPDSALPGLGGLENPVRESTLPEWLGEGDSNLARHSASLATIITHFVAKPLMKTGTYEEIQIFFYPFNENAGFANRITIGNFEVNLGLFADRLLRYRINNASRSGNFTLAEFWSFITTNIINNNAASSYGLWVGTGTHRSGLYERIPIADRDDSDDWATRVTGGDEAVYNQALNILLSTVTPTGEFRPPQLRMFTECLPVIIDQASGVQRTTGNILRIHIYDQQMSSVSGLSEILMAERNRALSLNGRPRNPPDEIAVSQWARYREELIARARDAQIIRNIGGPNATEQRYVIVGGSNRIKQFVMENSPYIMPGTQYSLVKGVTLSSLQDEAASTLNLVNAPRVSELSAPNGEEPSGLPLQVIPVEMNMTTQGCPLIGFSNQFFVDLNTGTTADDLYAVNRIDSNLEEGSYRTNIKLRPISGYTRYRNYLNEIRNTIVQLREITGNDQAANAAAANPPPPPDPEPGRAQGQRGR